MISTREQPEPLSLPAIITQLGQLKVKIINDLNELIFKNKINETISSIFIKQLQAIAAETDIERIQKSFNIEWQAVLKKEGSWMPTTQGFQPRVETVEEKKLKEDFLHALEVLKSISQYTEVIDNAINVKKQEEEELGRIKLRAKKLTHAISQKKESEEDFTTKINAALDLDISKQNKIYKENSDNELSIKQDVIKSKQQQLAQVVYDQKDALSEKITAFNEELKTLYRRIAREKDALNSQIQSLIPSETSLKDTHKQEISTLQEELKSYSAQLNKIENDFLEKIALLKSQHATLQKEIEAFNGDHVDIEKNIDDQMKDISLALIDPERIDNDNFNLVLENSSQPLNELKQTLTQKTNALIQAEKEEKVKPLLDSVVNNLANVAEIIGGQSQEINFLINEQDKSDTNNWVKELSKISSTTGMIWNKEIEFVIDPYRSMINVLEVVEKIRDNLESDVISQVGSERKRIINEASIKMKDLAEQEKKNANKELENFKSTMKNDVLQMKNISISLDAIDETFLSKEFKKTEKAIKDLDSQLIKKLDSIEGEIKKIDNKISKLGDKFLLPKQLQTPVIFIKNNNVRINWENPEVGSLDEKFKNEFDSHIVKAQEFNNRWNALKIKKDSLLQYTSTELNDKFRQIKLLESEFKAFKDKRDDFSKRVNAEDKKRKKPKKGFFNTIKDFFIRHKNATGMGGSIFTGAAIGAGGGLIVGTFFAPFTFGLSIPIFTGISAGVGAGVGFIAGATVLLYNSISTKASSQKKENKVADKTGPIEPKTSYSSSLSSVVSPVSREKAVASSIIAPTIDPSTVKTSNQAQTKKYSGIFKAKEPITPEVQDAIFIIQKILGEIEKSKSNNQAEVEIDNVTIRLSTEKMLRWVLKELENNKKDTSNIEKMISIVKKMVGEDAFKNWAQENSNTKKMNR